MIRSAMMETRREKEEAAKRLEEHFVREADVVRIERDVSQDLAKVGNFDVKHPTFETLMVREESPDFKATFNSPNFKKISGAVGEGGNNFASTMLEMKNHKIKAVIKRGRAFWLLSTMPDDLKLVANKPIKVEVRRFQVGTAGYATGTEVQFVGRRDMKGKPVSHEHLLSGFTTMLDSIKGFEGELPAKMNIMINNGVMVR